MDELGIIRLDDRWDAACLNHLLSDLKQTDGNPQIIELIRLIRDQQLMDQHEQAAIVLAEIFSEGATKSVDIDEHTNVEVKITHEGLIVDVFNDNIPDDTVATSYWFWDDLLDATDDDIYGSMDNDAKRDYDDFEDTEFEDDEQ